MGRQGLQMCAWLHLSESILQWTDGLTGIISRETDLLPFFKRPSGNPVKVSITNPTSKAGKQRKQSYIFHSLWLALPLLFPIITSTNEIILLSVSVCLQVSRKNYKMDYQEIWWQDAVNWITDSSSLHSDACFTEPNMPLKCVLTVYEWCVW